MKRLVRLLLMDDKKQGIQYYLFIQHWVIYKTCSCVLCRCYCIVLSMLQLWTCLYLNGFSSDQCQPSTDHSLVTMRRHGSSFLFLVPLARFQGPFTPFLVSISLYEPCRYIKRLFSMVLYAQLKIHIPSPPPITPGRQAHYSFRVATSVPSGFQLWLVQL